MQSETGFPSSHQLKFDVASKSRLKLAARCPVSGCWPSCNLLFESMPRPNRNVFDKQLRGYSIIGCGSGFTMNSNPKWIRLTLDTPKVIRFAKWISTQIHCESGSGSNNRIRRQTARVASATHACALGSRRRHQRRWNHGCNAIFRPPFACMSCIRR